MIPIIVVLWGAHGVVDVREHRRLVMGEFMHRGHAMAANLARSSELGAFAEDDQLLQASIRGVAGDPDLAYVVIYGEDGRRLTAGGRDVAALPADSWTFSASALTARRESRTMTTRATGERGVFVEFVAPIVSEVARTPDELLLGPLEESSRAPAQRLIGAVKLGLSTRSVETHLAALMRRWVIASVVVFTLATAGIYVFSRYLTGPIKRLTGQAELIADGVLDQTTTVSSRDEIGQLAGTFNRMGRALKGTIDEKEEVLAKLQELNRTLEDRIAERTAELNERTLELQRTLSDVRAMHEISRAVSSSLDMQEVLSTVVTRAVELSESDAGVIYEYHHARRVFEVRAGCHMERSLIEALHAMPLHHDEGALGRAVEARAPVQVSDTMSETGFLPERLRPLVARSGYRSYLAVPLLFDQRVIGGLVVFRANPGVFPPHTTELLQTVARHSLVAIRNAQLFREIEEKSRELAIASQHKSQFLANMSHELRTPLNAILGYTELVLDGIYGEPPGQIRDVMQRVEHNGRHLLNLINDVLDLSKIEAGQLALSLHDYSMQEVISAGMAAVESLGAEKDLRLDVDVSSDLPVGRGDERRITQAFLNLLGNAIKFTDAGRVSVRVSAANGHFFVSVADTGPGISEDQREKIFEEFHQADSSSTREKGGTGLGLAITKRMIEIHGGRLWVESRVGEGSTFSFTLPVRVDRPVEERS